MYQNLVEQHQIYTTYLNPLTHTVAI